MGILQARILEWIAMSSSKGSSHPVTEPRSPALQADSLLSEPPGKFVLMYHYYWCNGLKRLHWIILIFIFISLLYAVYIVDWPNSLFGVFHKLLQKYLNKLSGRPNVSATTSLSRSQPDSELGFQTQTSGCSAKGSSTSTSPTGWYHLPV